MEVILHDLIPDETIKGKLQEKYCVDALQEILQSDGRDYVSYFSSRAISGSIVEDIAELDAQISTLEKQVRKMLVDNKDDTIGIILRKSKETVVLQNISDELEHLWELDRKTEGENVNNTSSKKDLLFEEFLDTEENDHSKDANKQKSIEDDEFHKALKTLRQRISNRSSLSMDSSPNLTSIFENLTSITDLMELPSLARTCIRTGHYQEAIMLYMHCNTLKIKFPDSTIINDISASVLTEVSTTMLTGLVKLLSTNLTINSLKKILQYLVAIPPFDEKDKTSLLMVYLAMRLKFIQNEISSYSLDMATASDSMLEITIKRQIEVVREHIYMSLNTYMKNFEIITNPMSIPLHESLRNIPLDDDVVLNKTKDDPSTIETNPLILNFVNDCISYLLKEMINTKQHKTVVNNSVCLQLVYCSFRLNDLNANYHHLFLNKIAETELFTTEQLMNAIKKRAELASKYSFS